MAYSFVYANSGPLSNVIAWFDFGAGFTISPNQVIPAVSATMPNGVTVTFDLELKTIQGTPTGLTSVTPPAADPFSLGQSAFRTVGYTGLNTNNVVLLTNVVAGTSSRMELTLSNITVVNSQGDPLTNYSFIAADAQNTIANQPIWQESLTFLSNSSSQWVQVTQLPQIGSTPSLGLGQFPPPDSRYAADIVGQGIGPTTAYVMASLGPTVVTIDTQWPQPGLQQGFAIGFLPSQIQVYKDVAGRLDPSDQFDLSISGTPSNTVTTVGSSTGIQSVHANVSPIFGNTYTINETMSVGSVNPLSSYQQIVTGKNLTPGGTPVISPTTLPITQEFTFGDFIEYTILNIADIQFEKTVNPQNAKPGDILTYTVSVINPNNFSIPNALVVDPLPAGTTYIGNLIVTGSTSTGSDPMSGITLNSIPADTTATVQWQVLVNSTAPIPSSISNIATIDIPNYNSGSTNEVTTNINFADLTSPGNFTKTASPSYAAPGSIITYTITLTNTGTVSANNIVINDSIPAGTSYVSGSLNSTTPFSGDLLTGIVLTAPLAPSASVTFTFQVLVSDLAISPIVNTANVKYTFTIDPSNPNGETGTGISNPASVDISYADIAVSKIADKSLSYLGNTITYTILVKNNGNSPANDVVILDPIPNGTAYVSGSLNVSVPYTGTLQTGINLSGPIAPNSTVIVIFKVDVVQAPNPNPIANVSTVNYKYTLDPENPNGVSATETSTPAITTILANNFSQEATDVIQSVALQQAALAAIVNAEGKKIQTVVAMQNITPQQLLCLNNNVQDTLDLIALLESLLKQKVKLFKCQIDGVCK